MPLLERIFQAVEQAVEQTPVYGKVVLNCKGSKEQSLASSALWEPCQWLGVTAGTFQEWCQWPGGPSSGAYQEQYNGLGMTDKAY